MRTDEFKWYQQPFDEFNEAQAKAVPYLDKDCNLVICLNTAVGKTALAECAFGWHLQNQKGRCVFTAPLKSISSEKHTDWTSNDFFKKYGVIISDGDNHAAEELLDMNNRLLITTTESLDHKIRRGSSHDWIGDIDCLVIDESHLLKNEGRGATVESVLMSLTLINPDVRIILLSATMDNGSEIAKWIKSLNNKKTMIIQSDWRPTNVIPRFHDFENLSGWYNSTKKDPKWMRKISNSQLEQVKRTIEVLEEDHRPGKKTIIFVHSKVYGKLLGNALKDKGLRCGFHNASVDKKIRKAMENEFNSSTSGYDILIATSTLSAGVNIG